MKVKFKPVGVIKTRLGIERNGPVHKYFAERCRQHMNARYVPERQKDLTQTSVVDNSCNIIYKQPYAQYQYYGKLMVDPITGKGAFYNENYGFWSRPKKYGIKKVLTDKDLHYTKPGSGPYWDRKMKSVEMVDIEKEVQEYVERGCK